MTPVSSLHHIPFAKHVYIVTVLSPTDVEQYLTYQVPFQVHEDTNPDARGLFG